MEFRREYPEIDCANCDRLVEEGFADELNPVCRAGACTTPVAEGGLGVVELHPWNRVAVDLYVLCRALTPPVALALSDLDWHPDRPLLARQLALLAEAYGAPWNFPKIA